jgi:hypothetical protein
MEIRVNKILTLPPLPIHCLSKCKFIFSKAILGHVEQWIKRGNKNLTHPDLHILLYLWGS